METCCTYSSAISSVLQYDVWDLVPLYTVPQHSHSPIDGSSGRFQLEVLFSFVCFCCLSLSYGVHCTGVSRVHSQEGNYSLGECVLDLDLITSNCFPNWSYQFSQKNISYFGPVSMVTLYCQTFSFLLVWLLYKIKTKQNK